MPLIFFPFVFSALSDALVALRRIGVFLTSEDLPEPYPIDRSAEAAIEVDGDFIWETVYNPTEKGGKFAHGAGRKGGAGGKPGGKPTTVKKGDKGGSKRWWRKSPQKGEKAGNVLPSATKDLEKEDDGNEKGSDSDGDEPEEKKEKKEEERPFSLNNLKMVIPQGAFIGIVGRVGCGKVRGLDSGLIKVLTII